VVLAVETLALKMVHEMLVRIDLPRLVGFSQPCLSLRRPRSF